MKFLKLLLFFFLISICTSCSSWILKNNSPNPIYRAQAIRVNDSPYSDIIIIGGVNGSNHSNQNLLYNTQNDTWSNLSPMPIGNSEHSIAKFNNKIYVFGGVNVVNYQANQNNNVFEYDIANDTWTQKSNMPINITGASAQTVNELERIFIFGGESDPSNIPNRYVYEYNPLNDTWTQKSIMPTYAETHFSATLLNDNNIYIAGGEKVSTKSPELWKYNPFDDTWLQLLNLPYSISHHSASTTSEGNVLTIIGEHNFDFLPFAGNQFRDLPNRNNTVGWSELCVEYVTDDKGQRVGAIFVFGGNNDRFNTNSSYTVEVMY